MKHFKKIITSVIFALLVVAGVSFSDYFPDVIVTSPNGLWTDTRAYTTINAAVTAIGASQRDIYIIREEITTAVTIPSTVRLHFYGAGSISNSGQLTINTRDIFAGSQQIFTGTGDIDFATGSILKLSWFADVYTALTLTADDTVTIIMNQAATALASCAAGNNVVLKWESPGNILTSDAGVTVSNIAQIQSGDYQILAGAGDFRFKDDIHLSSAWFAHLRTIVAWVSTTKAVLTVKGTLVVDFANTIPANLVLDMDSQSGLLSIANGIVLTIHSSFNPGPHQVFTGLGTVTFGNGGYGIREVYPQWWGAVGNGTTDSTAAIQSAISSVTVTGSLIVKFVPGWYLVSDTLTSSVNIELTLSGTGQRYSSVIYRTTDYGDTLYITAGNTEIDNLHFQTAVDTDSGAHLHVTAGTRVNNCWFQNQFGGVRVDGTEFYGNNIRITSGKYFPAVRKIGSYGFIFSQDAGLHNGFAQLLDFTFAGEYSDFDPAPAPKYLDYTVMVDSADGLKMTGGYIGSAYTANMLVYGAAPTRRITGFNLTNVWFDVGKATAYGLIFNASEALSTAGDHKITSCYFVGGATMATSSMVYFADPVAKNILFANNVIGSTLANGLHILSDYTLVSGNKIGSTNGINGGHSDIKIGADVSYITIVGNELGGIYQQTPTFFSEYNIDITAGAGDYIKILGNNYLNAGTSEINNDATGIHNSIETP